ncbi:ion channel [Metabacillus idriensis]|uniref:ion channel n=1 Tax=Metabacillus idriensis TaxID=324768 RepID=UPI00174B7C21|nr:ion channel [Metabacillus idriensis]
MFGKREFNKKKLFIYVALNLVMIALLLAETFLHMNIPAFFLFILFVLLSVCIYLLFEFIISIPKTEESLQSIFTGSGLLISLIITTYANLYLQVYRMKGEKAFKFSGEELSGNDFMYYSITTFTTTGFGDITSIGMLSNMIAASEMLTGFIISTLFMALLTSKLVKNLK